MHRCNIVILYQKYYLEKKDKEKTCNFELEILIGESLIAILLILVQRYMNALLIILNVYRSKTFFFYKYVKNIFLFKIIVDNGHTYKALYTDRVREPEALRATFL